MPEIDKAATGTAGVMEGGALIVSVLGTEAPPASLPQGAFFDRMPGLVGTAPKAVGELGLGSMSPLAQDGAALQVILPQLYVRWSLSGEDARNALTAGGKEGGCRRRWGAGDKEMLLETGTDGA